MQSVVPLDPKFRSDCGASALGGARDKVPQRYHWSLIILHWLVVALLVMQYVTSEAIVRVHQPRMIGARVDPLGQLQNTMHTWTGLLIVALMLVRFGLRWRLGVPQLLGATWQSRLARAVHFAFYAILILQGITGAIAVYLWWPISAAHAVLFKVLLALIVLHVAAALWHQLVVRDGALRRIVGA